MNESNPSKKYKITVAYDGTEYCGWQIQPNGITVQEILQDKIGVILRCPTEVTGASRTDSGVHAIGQTAHFDSNQELNTFRFLASINGLIPRDIRVKSVELVSDDFHARYDALNKIYHYYIDLGSFQEPFQRNFRWHFPEKINLDLLKDCTRYFVGTHDFTSFANEPGMGAAKNAVRTLFRLDVLPDGAGIRLEFEGDGFLYKMVRNITGTLIDVSRGKLNHKDIPSILAAKDRRLAGRAAPPHGLFLVRVNYDTIQQMV